VHVYSDYTMESIFNHLPPLQPYEPTNQSPKRSIIYMERNDEQQVQRKSSSTKTDSKHKQIITGYVGL
jgi:hypothetical protein